MKSMALEGNCLPPPLPKKKGGTFSTNADNEFVKVVRENTQEFPPRKSNLKSSSPSRKFPKEDGENLSAMDEKQSILSRNVSHRRTLADDDEITNFLIEENRRRQKRYFGASIRPCSRLQEASATKKDCKNKLASSSQRNPTLGEIIRGEVKTSSKRSLQNLSVSTLQRCSPNYSSERHPVVPPPPHFSDDRFRVGVNRPIKGPEKPILQKTPMAIKRGKNVDNFGNERFLNRPKTQCLEHSSNVSNWLNAFSSENIPKSVQDAILSLQGKNEHKCINKSKIGEKEEFPIKKKSYTEKTEITAENVNFRRNTFKKGKLI